MKKNSSRTYFADNKGARAFQQSFAEQVALAAKGAMGHFVSSRNTHHLRHGGEWHNPANPHASSSQIATHTAVTEVTTKDLIDQRIELLENAIHEVAETMHQQFVRTFIQLMDDTTAQSGNVVDGANRSLSESFLEMLEKGHWSVNEAGDIEPPVFMSGAQINARFQELWRQAASEFREKANTIIKQKIDEAHREEAGRKARFSRYGDQ